MEEIKCVIILNKEDHAGTAANTIACLSFGLGAVFPNAIVPPTADRSGIFHGGIINMPVPVLTAEQQILQYIFSKAQAYDDVHVLDMNNRAQEAHSAEEYMALLRETETSNLSYAGIALYGKKQTVNKLTGSLKLFGKS